MLQQNADPSGSAPEGPWKVILKKAATRRANLSALVVILAGSLLHFAWEWSGRNPVVAVFAAINESTWEHLKLAFWPMLVAGLVHRMVYGPSPGWWVATALRCAIAPVGIVILFYSYTAVVGGHHLVGDIAVFVVAVVASEHVGHAALEREFDPELQVVAGLLLLVLIAAFATLSVWPPELFLFEDPALSPTRGG